MVFLAYAAVIVAVLPGSLRALAGGTFVAATGAYLLAIRRDARRPRPSVVDDDEPAPEPVVAQGKP